MENFIAKDAIDRYGEMDAQAKALKKDIEAQKSVFKEYFSSGTDDKSTLAGDRFEITYSVRESVSINEESVAQYILGRYGDASGYTRIITVLDMDAIEHDIYTGALPDDIKEVIRGAQTVKTTEVLNCKRKKK